MKKNKIMKILGYAVLVLGVATIILIGLKVVGVL